MLVVKDRPLGEHYRQVEKVTHVEGSGMFLQSQKDLNVCHAQPEPKGAFKEQSHYLLLLEP